MTGDAILVMAAVRRCAGWTSGRTVPAVSMWLASSLVTQDTKEVDHD
jgi:hypothetical protein